MNKITITLTQDQAYHTIQALEWSQDFDNKGQSKHNAFIQRIINKINAALVK